MKKANRLVPIKKSIKYIRNHGILVVPLVGFFVSVSLILWIFLNSDIKIVFPTDVTVKNFAVFYETPLQIFLISLTIWGFVIAYYSYTQTNKHFFALNKPYITVSEIAIKKVFKDRINLFVKFSNGGKTPAYNFKSDIKILSPIDITVKTNIEKEYQIDIPSEAYTSIDFDVPKTKLKNLLLLDTVFKFYISYSYLDFQDNENKLNEVYEINLYNRDESNLGKQTTNPTLK